MRQKKGITIKSLRSDNDVVDKNVDEFDEKFDESHDSQWFQIAKNHQK